MPVINEYFYPNGELIKAGTIKKNQPLANLYKDIAKKKSALS